MDNQDNTSLEQLNMGEKSVEETLKDIGTADGFVMNHLIHLHPQRSEGDELVMKVVKKRDSKNLCDNFALPYGTGFPEKSLHFMTGTPQTFLHHMKTYTVLQEGKDMGEHEHLWVYDNSSCLMLTSLPPIIVRKAICTICGRIEERAERQTSSASNDYERIKQEFYGCDAFSTIKIDAVKADIPNKNGNLYDSGSLQHICGEDFLVKKTGAGGYTFEPVEYAPADAEVTQKKFELDTKVDEEDIPRGYNGGSIVHMQMEAETAEAKELIERLAGIKTMEVAIPLDVYETLKNKLSDELIHDTIVAYLRNITK